MSPRRGDEVERWIKRERDTYNQYSAGEDGAAWFALDDLLDDYRLHADTGTPLDQFVSTTQQSLVEMLEPIPV
jgi:hypothetical protein